MGDRTEQLESRTRSRTGHNFMAVTHRFFVMDEIPDDAWRNADPILPGVGSFLDELLLPDNPYDPFVLDEARRLGVQLRRIDVDWLRNTQSHSVIILRYASGFDNKVDGSLKRKVIWEDDTNLETETIFFDILTGEPIPAGAQVRVPIVNSVGTLDGTQLTLEMENQVGTVNSHEFRRWPPGTLFFSGAQSRLQSGHDSLKLQNDPSGIALVTMSFLGRIGGWQERRPIKHPLGHEKQGQPTGAFKIYTKYPEIQFNGLFPDDWEPGA